MNFEIFLRRNAHLNTAEWYWRLKSPNGRVLVESGHGYENVKTCCSNIPRVKGSAPVNVLNVVTGESFRVNASKYHDIGCGLSANSNTNELSGT